jgi:hypothetical protein
MKRNGAPCHGQGVKPDGAARRAAWAALGIAGRGGPPPLPWIKVARFSLEDGNDAQFRQTGPGRRGQGCQGDCAGWFSRPTFAGKGRAKQ